jgi:hypothetical protein
MVRAPRCQASPTHRVEPAAKIRDPTRRNGSVRVQPPNAIAGFGASTNIMPHYTLLDATGNNVCTLVEETPDRAIERASEEIGKPLTFSGSGRAPYLLMPTDQASNLDGDPRPVEPERVVYLAT